MLAVACLEWKSDPELKKRLALPSEAYLRAIKRILPRGAVTEEKLEMHCQALDRAPGISAEELQVVLGLDAASGMCSNDGWSD